MFSDILEIMFLVILFKCNDLFFLVQLFCLQIFVQELHTSSEFTLENANLESDWTTNTQVISALTLKYIL